MSEEEVVKKLIEIKEKSLGKKLTLFMRHKRARFVDQLLSEKNLLEKLQTLNSQDIGNIKQAFVKYSHPRFMKAFSYHRHFGQNRPIAETVCLNQ